MRDTPKTKWMFIDKNMARREQLRKSNKGLTMKDIYKLMRESAHVSR